MKDFPGESYIVMKSNPIFPGGRPLLAIEYKYNYRKVLGFIATEGTGITEPGDTYLSRLPDFYPNISVCPVVRPHFLGIYFNACNVIFNHNMMRHYDLALDRY